jgi:hypothetical protein
MNMKLTKRPLKSVLQTVDEIIRLASEYQDDMEEYKDMNFFGFFNLVRDLEYKADPKGKESVNRPVYTLNEDWQGWTRHGCALSA